MSCAGPTIDVNPQSNDVDSPVTIPIPEHTSKFAQAHDCVLDSSRGNIRVNNKNLMKTFFDVDMSECDEMLTRLSERGLWSQDTNSWNRPLSCPMEEKWDNSLFLDVANGVSELDNITRPRPDGTILTWINTQGSRINSYWPESYDVPTDFIATLETVSPTTRSFHTRSRDPPSWNQVLIPGELKRRHSLRSDFAFLRLSHCIRRIYKEQPDRRFMFGFTFEYVFLTVWYCDRSGLVSSEHINVYESPHLLVQFLISCARMPTVDLGLDPTFLWFKEKHTHLQSYQIPPDVVKGGFETMPWIFEMPDGENDGLRDGGRKKGDVQVTPEIEGENNGGTQEKASRKIVKYVTFRALKVSSAEMMVGRATRVWLAYTLDDYLEALDTSSPSIVSTFQVYVLKDVWYDVGRTPEGSFYQKQGPLDGIARLCSAEHVKIFGDADKTERNRNRIGVSGRRVRLATESDRKQHAEIFSSEYPSTVPLTYEEAIRWIDILASAESKEEAFIVRAHYRLLLQTFGYSILDFTSHEEMLSAFLDAVKGHKNLSNAGYLHRDISTGNILIADQPSPNRGVLIDQDHAIPLEPEYQYTTKELQAGTRSFMAIEMLKRKAYVPIRRKYVVRPDLYPIDPYTPRQELVMPATLRREFRPRAIHDLEAFFWVLCWICVMTEGPSTPRIIPEEDDQFLWWDVSCMFASGGWELKEEILQDPEKMKKYILDILSPFYYNMRGLLVALNEVVFAVYHTSQYDMAYDDFIAAIEARLEELKARPDPMDTEYDTARARRIVTLRRQLEKVSEVQDRKNEVDPGDFEEEVAREKVELLEEKEEDFRVMIRRAELRRERYRFQRPLQFQDRGGRLRRIQT